MIGIYALPVVALMANKHLVGDFAKRNYPSGSVGWLRNSPIRKLAVTGFWINKRLPLPAVIRSRDFDLAPKTLFNRLALVVVRKVTPGLALLKSNSVISFLLKMGALSAPTLTKAVRNITHLLTSLPWASALLAVLTGGGCFALRLHRPQGAGSASPVAQFVPLCLQSLHHLALVLCEAVALRPVEKYITHQLTNLQQFVWFSLCHFISLFDLGDYKPSVGLLSRVREV
jgi:hypothetical protein